MNVRPEKVLPIRINDRIVYIASDDNYLDQLGEIFEPTTVELFRVLVKPDDVAFDIGANIGLTAILLSEMVKEVFCFEPSSSTFKFLEKNVAAAACANVRLENFGLGSAPSTATIAMDENFRAGAFITTESAPSSTLPKQSKLFEVMNTFENPT